MAATLAVGTAVPAFALTPQDDSHIPAATVTTTGSYVKGAATRAAMPAVEILGMASVEESGQFIDSTNYYNWAQPKYMLAATSYNQAISPYLANLATGFGTDTYPAAAFLSARTGGGAGPNASLGEGDTSVWALGPNVVVGTGGGDSNYASHGGAVGVSYGFSNYTGLAQTMHNIADAADAVAGGQLRAVDDAGDVADAYEQYVFGTMGAVARAVQQGTVQQRDVVLVTNATYDEEADEYTYTLMTTKNSGGDGTASTNRYLETTANPGITALSNIANNYADELVEPDSTAVPTVNSLALIDLVEAGDIDLIMVGGQQGSANYANIMQGLWYDQLLGDTYFVKDNGSAGSMYGVVMNSVENAQNIGRILGMLYPEVVNQQDWMAYYYQQFYHINASDLAVVMANALDGVRNAAVANSGINYNTLASAIASATEWDGNGGYAAGHSATTVQSTINTGYAWYLQQTQASQQ